MKPENRKFSPSGSFQPVYKVWSLDDFDEGYIPKHHKRFMVRLPGHHRANKNGWVLRSIAAYEAYHPGSKVTKDYVIHHKDKNKLNDSKENLQMMKFGEHSRIHNIGRDMTSVIEKLRTGKFKPCDYCGKEIYRAPWETTKTNFCSRKCHYAYKMKKVTTICLNCSENIIDTPSKERKYCSPKCFHEYYWRNR